MKKEYYIEIMSEDRYPDGSNWEDPHQKYGFNIKANSATEAKEEAVAELEDQGKPIFWAQVYEVVNGKLKRVL